MTDTLVKCSHCSRATEPAWEEKQEYNFDTKGLTIWRKATMLIRMTTLEEKRIGFEFSMDAELASKIDERMIADMVSREIGKLARRKLA